MEHKEAINNQLEQQEKEKNPKKKKNEDSVSSLWDNIKKSNSHIIGVPEGKEKQEVGNLVEKIVKENFPDLMKEIDMQVQEV